MLEPLFQDNREAFNRLHRRQIQTVIVGVLFAAMLGLMVLVVGPPHWIEWATYLLLSLAGVVIGVLEIKKTLVFRRDLRERRESSEGDVRPS